MRVRPRKAHDAIPEGQDAFLDVVANLVGILVILITVIGVGMRDAWVEAAIAHIDQAPVEALQDVAESEAQVAEIQQDITQMNSLIRNVSAASRERRGERDELLTRLEIVRQAMREQREYLDTTEQATLSLAQQVESQRSKLDELDQRRQAIESQAAAPQVLEHRSTPLAETVFGGEEHFRLLGGRMTYVPLNSMVEKLKSEASRNAWKLKDIPTITETIGPLDGFYMKYTLVRRDQSVMTKQGPATQRVVALDRFELIPFRDSMGKPLTDELDDRSELAIRLKGIDPRNTTITVWTYPDSYGDFRTLRDWLYERGYRAAARPLPEGQFITGSPRGSRSSAQ